MANNDIFGIEKKKKKDEVPPIKPIKYRVDPFRIMDGDIERVKRQTNVERNSVTPPSDMPNNRVEEPKRKEEE